MAAPPVVETLRNPDLGRRRADRAGWDAVAFRTILAPPASTRLSHRLAQGALRMSRGLRLIPIILLLWLVAGLAWRLVKPPDAAIPSQLVERPVPQFELAPALPT